MSNRPKCKATLKSGLPCRYRARASSAFCGVHGPEADHEIQKRVRELASRDQRLALLVATGLALIEILEKAIVHMPGLIQYLDSFREPTGNWLNAKEALRQMREATQSLVSDTSKIPLKDALSTLEHYQALIFWAVQPDRSFASLTGSTEEQVNTIRALYKSDPFLQSLYPRNFAAHGSAAKTVLS